uniref:C-type lectin domain-containing protein n=1 Tax=Oryzias sinensis TaxID=183150 RepID=A0A8C7WYC3_9TELE
MQFSVQNHGEQLTAVSEALKHLSAVDSLSRSVAELRCSLNRLSNNGSAEDGCCSLGWIQFGSSCYFFSRVSLNWDESKVWCEKQNAHLVIIITDEEWDFVTKTSIPDWYWVGLSDGRTGKWEWVNHTPYTVEHRRWRPGQPDNWVVLVLGSEDCAHLYADGLLNDLHSAPTSPGGRPAASTNQENFPLECKPAKVLWASDWHRTGSGQVLL